MNQVRYYFKKYGFVKTVKKVVLKTYTKIFRREQEAHLVSEREKYQIWIKNNEPDEKQLEEQKNTKFTHNFSTFRQIFLAQHIHFYVFLYQRKSAYFLQ